MKFMMMMNVAGDEPYQIMQWPKEAFQAHIQFMQDFNQRLSQAGQLVACEGLTGPNQAKLVVAGPTGQPITDGPFAESKEFLAGFWIIEVESAEQAYGLAAEVSAAPGADGQPLNMPIELRELMSAPCEA